MANIQDLQHRIDGVETDALHQDDLASQLKRMGKGKNDGITKLFNAMGSVGAAKFQIQAEKDREEAARLVTNWLELGTRASPLQEHAFRLLVLQSSIRGSGPPHQTRIKTISRR